MMIHLKNPNDDVAFFCGALAGDDAKHAKLGDDDYSERVECVRCLLSYGEQTCHRAMQACGDGDRRYSSVVLRRARQLAEDAMMLWVFIDVFGELELDVTSVSSADDEETTLDLDEDEVP